MSGGNDRGTWGLRRGGRWGYVGIVVAVKRRQFLRKARPRPPRRAFRLMRHRSNGLPPGFGRFRAIWRDAYELYASRTSALPGCVALRVTLRRAADRSAELAESPFIK